MNNKLQAVRGTHDHLHDLMYNYNYIKIDANRMITIKPSYPLNRLDILFEDLRPMEKIE